MLANSKKIIARFHAQETIVFLKQWLRHPLRMGSMVPSSKGLASLICQSIQNPSLEKIIELGAGTGRFTQHLLESGITPENLTVIEMDPRLCCFLEKKFPKVTVICGDAASLGYLIHPSLKGKISSVISGLPFMAISQEKTKAIIESTFQVLAPQGQFLQFTYGFSSPLPALELGLTQQRIGSILLNFPPANVWRYTASEKFLFSLGVHPLCPPMHKVP